MKNIQQVMKPFYKVVTIAISLSITTTMSFAQNLERRGDNNKCGYVESGAKKGFMGWKFVIKDNFTCSSKEFDKETNLAIVQSHSNNKWGIINTKGETIIPFEYSEELSMSKGKIAAKKDGKWGLIDTSGKTVLPFEYDYIKPESTDKTTILLVRKGEKPNAKYGFIDFAGKILVPIEYDEVRFVPMSVSNGSRHYNLKKEGKYGLYGLDEGKFLTDVKYDNPLHFTSTSLPLVYKGTMDGDEYEISETGAEKYLGEGKPKNNSSSTSSSNSSTKKADNKKDAHVQSTAKKEEPKKQVRYACTRCGASGVGEGSSPADRDLSGNRACKGTYKDGKAYSYTSHAWKKQ